MDQPPRDFDGRAGRANRPGGTRTDDDRTALDADRPDSTTRRRTLLVTGGVLAASTLPGLATADDANHYVIGAQTSHWEGENPSKISGEENPTLSMTVGRE